MRKFKSRKNLNFYILNKTEKFHFDQVSFFEIQVTALYIVFMNILKISIAHMFIKGCLTNSAINIDLDWDNRIVKKTNQQSIKKKII